MSSFMKIVQTLLKNISVEPVIVLMVASFNIIGIANQVGMYRVMCDKLFNTNGGTALNNHSSFDCWDTSESLGAGLGSNGTEWWYDAEILLQQQATSFSMISSLAAMAPGIISGIVLNAYGDRKGRKGVLLLGLFGITLMMVPSSILFAAPRTTPLYVPVIITATVSFTGALAVVFSACAAYLADITEKCEMLTIRMSIVQICAAIPAVVAPLIGNELLNDLGYSVTSVVAIAISACAFVCAVFTIKWIKPKSRNCKREIIAIQTLERTEKGTNPEDAGKRDVQKCPNDPDANLDQRESFFREICDIIKNVPHLLVDSFRTIFKKRNGHKRAYLFVAAYLTFVTSGADSTHTAIFGLFVQKEPLSWKQDQISYFNSVSSLISLGGTAIGIWLFKKCLHLPDTMIILIAITSALGKMTLIIFSVQSWMVYVAAGVGALANLSGPCMSAFIAGCVDKDEIGKAFGAIHLTTSFSFLYTAVGGGVIYKSTVASFPTLVFVIAAALVASALILSLWVHADVSRTKKNEK